MSPTAAIKRILYRTLPLESYLRVLSRGFFLLYRSGLFPRSAAVEYPRYLRYLVRPGDTVIDIGANLGYYARIFSQLVGESGRVLAVEPVVPVMKVLRHNLRRCSNAEFFNCALGAEEKRIVMANDSSAESGYMGTGRNFVKEDGHKAAQEFAAEMKRGSRLFGGLERIDVIKCDIEGYEAVVMEEMRPLIEKFLPTVLLETGGDNRRRMVKLFLGLGYEASTLVDGREVPLPIKDGELCAESDNGKDIIFRHPARRGTK